MLRLTRWLKSLWTKPKSDFKPKLDFILTKKQGRKGGIVLHIESVTGDTYCCTKGSFRSTPEGLIWVRSKGSRTIDISTSNIETFLDAKAAEKLIQTLIK